jgi:transposase
MSHWARPPVDRHQVTLFAPTLDDSIRADHPVRLFDEVLRGTDFGAWEARYVRDVGQPPIHPRPMAAAILYGLSLGIRSSRRLQDAALNRLDFLWLLEGRAPDHATFCGFRTRFADELKALSRQVGRVAVELGMVTLNQVALDGTTVRACNARGNAARRATLEQKVAALDAQVDAAMREAAARDAAEDQRYGSEASPAAKLPRDLADLKRRQERLRAAMANLAAVEATRAARGGRADLSPKGPSVPPADPDARVLPNKDGGHAPNHTAVLAVDAAHGVVVDARVLAGNDEAAAVMPAVADVEQRFGSKPDQLVADSGFNTGANLTALEAAGVEPLMPARQTFARNPAVRPDPTRPVPEPDRAALPVNPQNKILDKAAFAYDAARDRYHCPMGRELPRGKDRPYDRHGVKGVYRIYESAPASCAGCPLAAKCLPKGAVARRVSRDEHEPARERMAARLATDAGRQQYRRRSWAAETPFAFLKSAMGLRRFLLRGPAKVGTELTWAATAYNLVKITRFRAAATT